MKSRNFKTNDHKGVFSLFGYRPRVGPRASLPGIVLISAGLLVGCAGNDTRDDGETQYYTDQSSAVFAPDPGAGGAWTQDGASGAIDDRPIWELGDEAGVLSSSARGQEGEAPQAPPAGAQGDLIGGWSIALTKLGSTNMRRAQELLRVIQDDAGLRKAFIEQRTEGLVIAYGNYMGRDEAERELDKVRKTKLMGTTPFENAIVMPPASAELRGSNPAWDLRTVKQRYGKQAVYTLQIGVYGRADYQTPEAKELTAYRKAAEAAVRELRAEGEMAFYYHAPARSMVTVGVFGEKDFDSTTRPPMQSPSLKAVRDRFPNNLLNGQGINETIRTESGRETRLQSSQLVAIPEN